MIELVDFSDHDRTLRFVESLRTVEMRKSKCQSYYKFVFVFPPKGHYYYYYYYCVIHSLAPCQCQFGVDVRESDEPRKTKKLKGKEGKKKEF